MGAAAGADPGRQLLAVVVAVLTAFAAVRSRPTGRRAPPVFTLPDRVIDATVGGGRLFVTRLRAGHGRPVRGPGPSAAAVVDAAAGAGVRALLFAYDGVAVVVGVSTAAGRPRPTR
ncbi:hypothetical protein GCM10020218_089870 [Dactylosporangium vinaceum]